MDQLPFLLKLVDDPSPSVREKVAERLRELGPGIWDKIQELDTPLTTAQEAALGEVLCPNHDQWLLREWAELQAEVEEHAYLERGLLLLAEWQTGADGRERGKELLDEIANEYLAREPYPTAASLALFLFEEKGLQGAPQDDYYNPLNSNLVYCLISRQGLPITLCAVFVLVGERVGLSIEGCNFPGHFLARDTETGTVFDPFNAGRILPELETRALYKAAPEAMSAGATSRGFLLRVLRNLSLAFHHAGEPIKASLMLSLIRQIEEN